MSTAISTRWERFRRADERNELAKEIQEQVYKDLPVIYLVDPQWHIAVSDKLKDYEPYCGDYYVVNDQLGLTNS